MVDEYIAFVEELKQKWKPNPFGYLIVDKWNCKYVWNPNKHIIFGFISLIMEEKMKEVFNDGYIDQFCDVKQISY